MKFNIITIFPEAFGSYLNASILKRAQKNRKIKINIINLRDFALRQAQGKQIACQRQTIDDKPYGGGAGMVFKIEPIVKALGSILNLKSQKSNLKNKVKIILFSASGKQFDSKMASDFAKKYDRIIMIAGHYEGVDERIKSVIKDLGFKFQEISIGPYVLTGGELPVMVVIDAVSRHIPGVLGKIESLEEKRYGIGVPTYTRPEVIKYKNKKYAVPKILLSGNHKKIENWRKQHQK
ncbi:MAG: tRNA (guanosine(37)-N1)-methyltransferase TrmD [Candidatus Azambacteria bacterium]|nr:tRNA (guanosine(37)-N1)-methyltransferase TrmD [Candidatus Azambacteria bacterium]